MRQELFWFLAVGATATLTHVFVATLLQTQFTIRPQLANLAGYVSAVSLSYFGHGRLTFGATLDHARQAPKFVVVSLAGLAVGAVVVDILSTRNGVRFEYTMGVVGIAVALTTFLLSKFWVFAQGKLSNTG